MTTPRPVSLRQAVFPADRDTVARLFGAYVDFLVDRVPPEVAAPVLAKYPPEGRSAAVDDFARRHGPPRGALLLVEIDGRAIGCGMMQLIDDDTAELARIYLAPETRGQGLGRRMVGALLEAARAAGAGRVVLDTGGPLTEAITLYRSMGFVETAPYHDAYPDLQPHLVFFARDL
jgi:GNAT superfamily N-acetyltransferase